MLLLSFVQLVVRLRNDLPPRFESAQYRIGCAAMPFRHNGIQHV
jgi:hypothetical protein